MKILVQQSVGDSYPLKYCLDRLEALYGDISDGEQIHLRQFAWLHLYSGRRWSDASPEDDVIGRSILSCLASDKDDLLHFRTYNRQQRQRNAI